jgi:transcriptional regulator with XRE-family HTH domain
VFSNVHGQAERNLRTFRSGPYLEGLFTGPMAELDRRLICARIKQARKEAGLTQEELADLLRPAVRARTIANYESERVPWRYLGQIAEITGRSQEWLLHGELEAGDVPERLGRLEAVLQEIAGLQAAILAELQRSRTP